ncbi:MAG: alcohol dehydrogenase [Methanobacteriota archaeon]|nr:MAG: alcohol dehydrogenase [Euryarchaeota archaeon]|tara:strand:+ start:7783 stop:8808 length:1026 start_codon:yes stop_codon:yes gene_type:complete
MRTIIIEKYGSPDVLKIVNQKDLVADEGEVIISVNKAGVNFADLMMRLGIYGKQAPKTPFTPGYEVSGIISSIGPGVHNFSVGQRVVALTGINGYSEEVKVPVNQVVGIGNDVSFEAAAAMPVTYLTAFHMLVELGKIREGDTVLIHHAAGGVGTAAFQIAKAYNAGIIFGVASSTKKEFVEKLGMRFIDRNSEDFVEVVKRETNGAGVHHVLDPVGGQHLRKSFKSLRSGGKLYSFGGSSFVKGPKIFKLAALWRLIRSPKFSPLEMIGKNKAIFGVHMGTIKDFDLMRNEIEIIVQMLNQKKIEPIIDKIFNFKDVAEAHHYIHDRKNRGKVLLDFTSD